MTVAPLSRPHPRSYRVGKRALDVLASSILLLLLSPILLVTALLVRVTSRGPVLFRQTRIGEDGRPFMLYKFRSMHVDAPAYAKTPENDDDDPRVTQLGRYLRPSSIDELPQLLNVLKGDMSLVGPRPEMPFIVDTYTTEQRRRLRARPGMTGLWQISPARFEPIHENLQYDFYYISHASLTLDLNVIARTVSLVLWDTLAAGGRLWVRVTTGQSVREREALRARINGTMMNGTMMNGALMTGTLRDALPAIEPTTVLEQIPLPVGVADE